RGFLGQVPGRWLWRTLRLNLRVRHFHRALRSAESCLLVTIYFRLFTIADACSSAKAPYFNHLVGAGQHGRRVRCQAPVRRYCMNHPWLTTKDWPVSALDPNAANSSATSATSASVVTSPSTVSLSITFLTTSSSVMPSSRACSGICLSTSGVRTYPGQITLARMPCLPPSLATVLHRPIRPCLAVT